MPDPQPDPSNTPPAPPAPSAPAAPPPASKVVLEGTKTEREIALERDKKSLETRVSELEDQNSQLKTIPRSQPKAKKQKPWLETVLDDDED